MGQGYCLAEQHAEMSRILTGLANRHTLDSVIQVGFNRGNTSKWWDYIDVREELESEKRSISPTRGEGMLTQVL